MGELSKADLLRSWKEIAAYLGCDRRTCYRWEKSFGMPVHRAAEGYPRSGVFAYKEELDSWFQKTFPATSASTGRNGAAANLSARRRPNKFIVTAIFVFAIVSLYFALKGTIISSGPDRQPADFSIEGSTLIILNKHGDELWKKEIPEETLQSESSYRENAQFPRGSGKGPLYWLIIRDINGDGLNEVLFAVKCLNDQTGEGDLYCWDASGKKPWHIVAGREMTFGDKIYSPDYRIGGFTTHDIDGDGRRELILISYQAPQWPCELSVLDCDGHKRGEYWNSGYLLTLIFSDIDGNGRDELLVAGDNNQYGACLAIFDPLQVRGASPQTGEFKAQGVPEGSQLAYMTFPRTDVNLGLKKMAEGVIRVEILRNSRILLTLEHGVLFETDFKLRCLSVDWTHGYILAHRDLKAAGRVTSTLGNEYREAMRRRIRYWDGRNWLAEPPPFLKTVVAEK